MSEDDKLHTAVATAMRTIAKDADVTKAFWKSGAEELGTHFSDKAKKTVGGWLIVLAVGAVGAKLVVWLVQTGAIK